MDVLIFLSSYHSGAEVVETLSGDGVGIVLAGNAVYHAVIKERGRPSPLLSTKARFYILREDLESRGFDVGQVPATIRSVTYDDLVDLMFNDYKKAVFA